MKILLNLKLLLIFITSSKIYKKIEAFSHLSNWTGMTDNTLIKNRYCAYPFLFKDEEMTMQTSTALESKISTLRFLPTKTLPS